MTACDLANKQLLQASFEKDFENFDFVIIREIRIVKTNKNGLDYRSPT